MNPHLFFTICCRWYPFHSKYSNVIGHLLTPVKISRTNVALYSTVHLNFSFEEHHASVSSALQQSILQDEIKVLYKELQTEKKNEKCINKTKNNENKFIFKFFLIFIVCLFSIVRSLKFAH